MNIYFQALTAAAPEEYPKITLIYRQFIINVQKTEAPDLRTANKG